MASWKKLRAGAAPRGQRMMRPARMAAMIFSTTGVISPTRSIVSDTTGLGHRGPDPFLVLRS
jgi:hypothetical protein